MRVCVVGCGAIGGLFAARLATQPDVDVWAYDVSEEHVAAINRDGLAVDGEFARVQARTDAGEIPPCDFGLLATKATLTEPAIAATAHLFGGGAVCSLQNGIGSEEVIARHVPRVIRGVTLVSGHVTAPGTIHMDAPGTTWMGPFEPQPASAERIAALARATGAVALADARGAQWTKLLFNAATNPLAALTGLTHGELCERPDLRAVVGGLVAEGRRVADALGIALDADPEEMIDRAARENRDHRPSMLQDALAHRPTEIDALNGGIVRAGAQAGVPTPLHAAIAALIRGMEAAW
ncbi:MAG TPA: 2-dehydropantoate 2-reductase [Solirubrobacteraceae bacterium]